MPDISMCMDDECPARAKCYRHKASGTRPNEPWQSYADFQRPAEDERCGEFWPARTIPVLRPLVKPDSFTIEELQKAIKESAEQQKRVRR